MAKGHTNKEVKAKLNNLYDEVFLHDGYGEIKVEFRILKKGQKEVIIHCGKQYRFVVNYVRTQEYTPMGTGKSTRA
ncbi:MAG: hypothetical protein KAS46_01510 [Candidatus Aureabacteria bacterium]|nr:hypothetical protein [Candidatus Auribacterota bacterium]